MRTIKSMSELTDPEKIKKAKEITKLSFLDDESFIKVCKQLSNNKIKLRNLLQVTLYIKPENFFVDKVINYILSLPKENNRGLIYDPENISARLNISIDEAKNFVNKYKKDKATSKEGFIKRHGEDSGIKKFKKFQKTSGFANSDQWFKQKFGENWEIEKKQEAKRRSQFSIDFWIKKGFSKEDSIKKVKESQREFAGVNRKYWENQGLSKEEVDLIISQIYIKKGLHNRNRFHLKKIYGKKWKDIYNKTFTEYRKRMEQLKLWIPLDIRSSYLQYRRLCNFYTEQSIIDYKLKDIETRSIHFHLDHKFSIKMGFLLEIDPQIIGSIVNLEILPALKNISKNYRCSITKEELLTLYEDLKNENKKN